MSVVETYAFSVSPYVFPNSAVCGGNRGREASRATLRYKSIAGMGDSWEKSLIDA